MCEKLSSLVVAARAFSAGLDVAGLTSDEAAEVFASAARLERLAAGMKVLVAPRLAESTTWARSGDRSAEEWMARSAGTGLRDARKLAETAEKLTGFEATAAKLRSGELSLPQAEAVAQGLAEPAGRLEPEEVARQEAELLEVAAREPLHVLRDRARRMALEAKGTVEERYARQRRLRSLRHWIDDEGMVAGSFRLTPDVGSAVVRAIGREADRRFRAAHRRGEREPSEAYAADALAALITGAGVGGGAGPKSKGSELVVLVSHEALRRSHVEPGSDEVCEVPGFGAVPVSVARDLVADCFLKGVVHDGVRVTHVKHFGRHRPAEVDTALLAQNVLSRGDLRCIVEGCGRTVGLQWDHKEAFARGGATSVENLQPMCGHHNRSKETGGVRQAADGRWVSVGRDPPGGEI